MTEINLLRELPCGILFHDHRTAATPDMPGHIPHTHEFCELYFYLSGKCSYMVENGLFALTGDTVIFTRPGELHCVRVMEPCSYARSYFYIPPNALAFLGEPSPMRFFFNRPFGQSNYLRMPPDTASECRERLGEIRSGMQSDSPDRSANALAQLLLILAAVNRVLDTDASHAVHAAESSAILSEALRCMNAEIGEIRSADDLARRLYVSREYLSRLFSRTMGITLSRYITLKRIELAKRLLSEGAALNDVCAACGWGDYSYFISLFHRETGVTPAKYRSGKR